MQDIMNWIPATNNMTTVKELERKIAVLERSNKALTDRLARTEHKVSALFQWALSFPALAASQNIMKSNKRSGQGSTSSGRGGHKRRASTSGSRGTKSYRRDSRKLETTVIEMGVDDEEHVNQVEVMQEEEGDDKHLEDSLVACPSDNVQREEIYNDSVVEGSEPENNVDLDNISQKHKVTKRNNLKKTKTQGVSSDDGMMFVQDGKYFCNICGNSYSYSHGLRRHINVAHLRTDSFACKNCGKSFHRRDKKMAHERKCSKK